jgi:predicted nucleic acid-binding Zn finger protein
MSDHDTTEVEATDAELDARDVRALTEYMTVLPKGGDVYSVTTESGSEYTVDAREGRCTCPDYKHNLPTDDGRHRCKHAARVAYATGGRPVPAWVDTDAVDPDLGAHVDATPRVAATDGGIVEAGDDGEILTDADDATGDDGRPDECDCGAFHTDAELACWPCYRDGFETPADADE